MERDIMQELNWQSMSVNALLARLTPAPPLTIIGIDGRSRSGKTTLAGRLAGEGIVVIHTDDVAWHHSFFDWTETLVTNLLRPLRDEGLPVSFTPSPWVERGRPGRIDIPDGTRIVVVEGVGAARAELSDWLDATIWVETSPELAMGRTRELDREPAGFVEDWMRAENAHLQRDQPWMRATAIVRGGDPAPCDGTVRVAFT